MDGRKGMRAKGEWEWEGERTGKKGTKGEWENKVNEKGWNGNVNERENMNEKQNGMGTNDRMGMRT